MENNMNHAQNMYNNYVNSKMDRVELTKKLNAMNEVTQVKRGVSGALFIFNDKSSARIPYFDSKPLIEVVN
jgi:hypothetical protein